LKITIISLVLLLLLGATGAGVSGQPVTPGAERFVLTGMVMWSGNEGVAYLQEPDLTRNELVTLRIGESVGPWKLTRFLDNGVELDGPTGKVLVPLHNAGGRGTAVATGAPAGSAPAAGSTARTLPRDDASRNGTPPASVSSLPGFVGDANRPAANANALSEAFNRARAARAQQQAESAASQPREAAPARDQAVRGPSTPSSATSSHGSSAAEGGANSQVIQFPRGGGKQGIRELFGAR
jgi:hypothetical protein